MDSSEKVYFDNNGTTIPPPIVQKRIMQTLTLGNASSSYHTAKRADAIIEACRSTVRQLCQLTIKDYEIIFTSGATESNVTIIYMTTLAYRYKMKVKPHVLTSNVEHKSIIETCENLRLLGLIEFNMVKADKYGIIDPKLVEEGIYDNTCLISIMHANNETGAVNDIKSIGEIAHKHQIPFHTDVVQTFGKVPIKPNKVNVDAFSASFHKLYGPIGVGLLVIKKSLLNGYEIKPLMPGSQNGGYRGGTSNTAGIAGSLTAMRWCFKNRAEKNKRLLMLSNTLIDELKKTLTFVEYGKEHMEVNMQVSETKIKIKKSISESLETPEMPDDEFGILGGGRLRPIQLILLGPPMGSGYRLPNTVLIAVIKNTGKQFCNIELKTELDKHGFIVSIGSACNTSSSSPSHIMYAIAAAKIVRCGVIRISFGDTNTLEEVRNFAREMLNCIKKQCTISEWNNSTISNL